MRVPVNEPYVISTYFGVPDSNALFGKHSGIDYAVGRGTTVYAPASGSLTNVDSPTGGNMVVIFDGTYYHRLMHNTSFSRGNGSVSEGDEVAKSGSTGLSTGPHVHWDVNTQKTYPTSFNAFVDPQTLIKKGNPVIEPATIISTFSDFRVPGPTDDQIEYYGHHQNGYDELHTDMAKYNLGARTQAEAQVVDLTRKLEIAQASDPNSDATKWQQLKVLFKALLS